MRLSKKNLELGMPKLRALAMGAILFELNESNAEDNYDLLEIYGKESLMEDNLKNNWSVENRNDLLETFEWLLNEGHNKSFSANRSFLRTLSETNQHSFIESLPKDTEEYHYFLLVKTYDILPPAGIFGYDLGRLVFLARLGICVDYLTEEEAYDFMLKAAKLSQQAYSSWLDFGISFIVGRQLLFANTTAEKTKEQADLVKGLIMDENSLWNQLDWNLKLD